MIPKSTTDFPTAGWHFHNSYTQLPGVFFTRVHPGSVRLPKLVLFNSPLAESLGLPCQNMDPSEAAFVFSGNTVPEGADPIAQAYAGHQFGHFTVLGDGRAILLGEHLGPDGKRWDIQLKGSGRTSYSRRGDGRAALGPMLREYIISEALHALGIPTTRSLAVASTGESVFREEELPGAVLTRVAASHIRVGTFEYAAMQQSSEILRALADYTMHRHYPELSEGANRYRSFLEAVIERQASLVAKWLLIGFVHGVMNTDNMAVSGETIDYGPCAFLDVYDPATVFSSIDRNGRYAYANQPGIAHWNLARFAECLLPILDSDEGRAIEVAKESLALFSSLFEQYWLAGMRAKLGLFTEEPGDLALVESLLHAMNRTRSDYTNTFRNLDPERVWTKDVAWHSEWGARLGRQEKTLDDVRLLMRMNNPVIIPRNFKVEEALVAAVSAGDHAPLNRLLAALAKPFEDGVEKQGYQEPPPEGLEGYQTFCGT